MTDDGPDLLPGVPGLPPPDPPHPLPPLLLGPRSLRLSLSELGRSPPVGVLAQQSCQTAITGEQIKRELYSSECHFGQV